MRPEVSKLIGQMNDLAAKLRPHDPEAADTLNCGGFLVYALSRDSWFAREVMALLVDEGGDYTEEARTWGATPLEAVTAMIRRAQEVGK